MSFKLDQMSVYADNQFSEIMEALHESATLDAASVNKLIVTLATKNYLIFYSLLNELKTYIKTDNPTVAFTNKARILASMYSAMTPILMKEMASKVQEAKSTVDGALGVSVLYDNQNNSYVDLDKVVARKNRKYKG